MKPSCGIATAAVACALLGAGCGGSSTHTQINSAERASLRQLAVSAGERFNTKPTDIQAVRTTYARYEKILGGPPIGGAGAIYAVSMRGHFKLPAGPAFPYNVLIVDARTNKRLSGLLSPSAPQLSRVGPVTKL